MGAPGWDMVQSLTLQQLQLWRPLSRGNTAPAPPKGEAQKQATPFRGKYLEEWMGAPGWDMVQSLTLQKF